jgi:ATP-binding cassette, subfamily C (CFTR/MRP), member 1
MATKQSNHILLTSLNPLLSIGSKRSLTLQDIPPIPEDAAGASIYQRFQKHWNEELLLPTPQRSLWRVLIQTTGYQKQLFAIFLNAIGVACSIGPPQLLRVLSMHFNQTKTLSTSELWIFVSLLFILPVMGIICSAHSYVIFSHSAVVVRGALIAAIYRKSLVLSNQSRTIYNAGRIMNLFGTDITITQNFFQLFGDTIFAPVQLGVALGLIYREVGTAMFAGLGTVLFILPIIMILFILISLTRRKKSSITDKRISLMNEVLTGIRIIKYYAWEIPFSFKVDEIRKLELKAIFTVNLIMVLIATVFFSVSYVLPIVIFYTFTQTSNRELDTTIAFTTLALLGLITTPMSAIPAFLQRLTSTRVAISRIIDFLQSEELEEYIDHQTTTEYVIEVKNASAGWLVDQEMNADDLVPAVAAATGTQGNQYEVVEKKEGDGDGDGVGLGGVGIEMEELENGKSLRTELNRSMHTLTGLNFSIPRGKLVAIVGGVGSGKSSILSLLLGDLKLLAGAVSVGTKNLAYHSQQPWILNASMQDNITCGLPLDPSLLELAIDVACLRDDLKILPAGLDTEIGEKGINLSGGQVSRWLFFIPSCLPSFLRKLGSHLLVLSIGKRIFIFSVEQRHYLSSPLR